MRAHNRDPRLLNGKETQVTKVRHKVLLINNALIYLIIIAHKKIANILSIIIYKSKYIF